MKNKICVKMILKKKPTTPSQRNLIRLNNSALKTSPFIKSCLKGLKKCSSTSCNRQIVCKNKGGGTKRRYRSVDFKRNVYSIGIIVTIEYDPYRSSNICAVYDFLKKNFSYILAPSNIGIGDIVKSGKNVEINDGNSIPLSKIPIGSLIHNVSTKINKKGELSRSAGTFSQLIEKTPREVRISLSSGEHRYISSRCFVTLGSVSNDAWFLTTIGKAGRSRWLNKRPKVRGVAKNPLDHPHGGGEGKTSGGRSTSVTPWGKPTKNKKTSKSNNKLRVLN